MLTAILFAFENRLPPFEEDGITATQIYGTSLFVDVCNMIIGAALTGSLGA